MRINDSRNKKTYFN